MSIGISPCPDCGTLLLDDTVECHRCHHVFDRQKAQELAIQDLPTDDAVLEDLAICHHCGEGVRSGLVRCWNCQNFLRADIQAAYDSKMGNQPATDRSDQEQPGPRSLLRGLPRLPNAPAESDFVSYGSDYAVPVVTPNENESEDLGFEDEDDFELANDAYITEQTYDTTSESVSDNSNETFALQAVPEELNVAPAGDEFSTDSPLMGSADGTEEAAVNIPMSVDPETIGISVESETEEAVSEEPNEDELLMQIALMEEKEELEQSKLPKKRGFITSCEAGCKVRVMDHHRGKVGKCPKCGAKLSVPLRKTTGAGNEEAAPVDPPVVLQPLARFIHVMQDVAIYSVPRGKLKIAANAYKKPTETIDLAIDPQTLVMLTWPKGTMLKPTAKKIPEFRANLKTKLTTNPGETDLSPASVTTHPLSPEALAIVQPTVAGGNELLGGVEVFGPGRIAVEFLTADEAAPQQFFVMNLTQFRHFAAAIRQGTPWTNFADGTGIPLTSEQTTHSCHYLETPVLELQQLPYFQNDPTFTLKINGYRCQGCELVVSEDARKKEKIGGKTPASIKSAKCPKCQKPFGHQPLYTLDRAPAKR